MFKILSSLLKKTLAYIANTLINSLIYIQIFIQILEKEIYYPLKLTTLNLKQMAKIKNFYK